MRISDWSSDVCSSDLADQEQMDKAELLREFVFNAVPKGEGLLRDPSGGQVRVQVRLLGFDGPPEFEEFGAGDSADAAPTAEMTRELEELFDAVQAAALTSRYGTATTGNLRRRLATAGGLLPGLAQLHAQGRILLEQRKGGNGPSRRA